MDSSVLWVGLGGFVGANARYLVGRVLDGRLDHGFPVATLIVNVTGSLAMGVALTLLTERFVANPAWRLVLVVGFLGGYTTFSAFTSETVTLLELGAGGRAAFYVVVSNIGGLMACFAGILLARWAGK